MKKKALVSSILTIALCVCLIAGSTLALFTSESTVNVAVTAGNVELVASIGELTLYSPKAIGADGTILDDTDASGEKEFANGGTAVLDGGKLTLTNITPGDKVEFDITVENKSNVMVQYQTVIGVEDSEENPLWNGLVVTMKEGDNEFTYNGKTRKSEWTALAPDTDPDVLHVTVELPASAGNEYQNGSCELTFTVTAFQGNVEHPSEWDGETTTAPSEDEDGVIHITTASEFVYFIETNSLRNGGKTVVLDKDIDLGGATIKINSERIYDSNFDGQNHTVSNFTIEGASYYISLFGYAADDSAVIKNLTVKNATVSGAKQVGVFLGAAMSGSTVANCHVVDCTLIATKKVGAIVGYTENGIITNCSAKDTTIYVEETGVDESGKAEYGKLVGYINETGGCTDNTSGLEDDNVTIIFMARVDSFDAFTEAVNNTQISKIVLTGDITNEEVPHTGGTSAYDPYGEASNFVLKNRDLTIDFNGHVLTTPVRLFDIYTGATLTLENSSTSGAQSGIYFNKTDSDPNFAKNAYGIRLNIERKNGTTVGFGVLNINENVTLAIGLLNASAQPQYGGMIDNSGNVNMNGGELIAYGTSAVFIFSSAEGDFIMNDGKITLGDSNATGITSFINSNAEVKLIKGSIEGEGTSYNIFSLSSNYKFDISDDFVIDTAKGPQE